MKDFNFDRMKNFNVSDEWADKVLVTASSIKSTPKPNIRVIATCLSLAFVCIISVTFYGYHKNLAPTLPIDNNNETISETKNVIENTKAKETESSTKVTETVEQTQAQTDVYVKATTQTYAPIIKPTETFVPTYAPTEPITEPVAPTIPENTEPTEKPSEDTTPSENRVGDCIVSFSPSYLVDNGKIFCRIKDINNESLGDSNLFSDQHLASFYSGFGSKYYYLYSPERAGLILEPGTYRYYFYNEHGVPILNVTVVIE